MHVIAHWYNYERLVSLASSTQLRAQWPWEARFVPDEAQPNLRPYATAGIQLVSWYLWIHVQLYDLP